MLNFYEKRRLKGILTSTPVLVLMVLPIGFVGYAAWNARDTAQETELLRNELSEELAELEMRAAALETDIADLEDPRGVEAALRQRFELGKEGEDVIVFIEEEEPEPTVPEPTEEQPRTFTDRFKEVFGIGE